MIETGEVTESDDTSSYDSDDVQNNLKKAKLDLNINVSLPSAISAKAKSAQDPPQLNALSFK